MHKPLRKIVIVGGGSAGWLTAGVIAAEHSIDPNVGIEVTLIESADVAPIGVGEGTWPTMRSTLKKMGISETDFLLECDASFKQGSKFSNWHTNTNEHYYHPFTLPHGFNDTNLASFWQPYRHQVTFADAVGVQSQLGEHGLAPKQISTAEYDFNANYGYHLDAGKFAALLQKHCTTKLAVKHIIDHVTQVNSAQSGDIATITTKNNGDIAGDLFIDCTGTASLLLAKHYAVPFVSTKHILFNDSALAVHVPHQDSNSPIASFTCSTAQSAGWIWDIGLPSRRGVGYTYSSRHITDVEAEKALRDYITPIMGESAAKSTKIRKIDFSPGYREKFWHKNCVAVGLSAGFIEPLEATALALIELSAKMISEQLPADREAMDLVAKRFNAKFLHRWLNIVDFLKLHYVLSNRTDSAYWREISDVEQLPDTLKDQLLLWKTRAPYHYDATHTEEMFPPASYQYILYGMDFITQPVNTKRMDESKKAQVLFAENAKHTKQLLSSLPSNRELINKIKLYGLPKI
ncbi:tryptophan halogenase family protein [Glaciecola sp. 33A]|jgi:tryptophan halogenase|uniref:tryptophan halogenase family protein n=1 Tax=Glaciecola sp. 33A TaxID=2057807 RepID=UPI000C34E2E6|nr:tryptophan halogenase family protein [Glaciecola sp. 33A]PKI01802.1 tryptophan halogenase [Glaciecola sp. 33A]